MWRNMATATKDAESVVILLLLNSISVLSYLQFVVPGVTETDSSKIYISELPSGPNTHWPNRTVDGNFSQNVRACFHTADKNVTEAWLRIDLQAVKSIKSVKFWYRNDRISAAFNTIRLRGYSIRVSNTSDVSPGSTDACFTDDMSQSLPTIIQEDCKRTTRYVWFYQDVRSWDDKVPILEICEVQVFECFPGIYGPDCRSHCSLFCRTYYCDRVTGACLHYCQNGYLGPYCNHTCPSGLYGQYCSKSCGNCLQNTTCNHGNGTCLNGCDAGYKGKYCTTPCSTGEYGGNCIHKCSENCGNGEVCDKVHGHCASCAPGFQGLQCDEKCKNRSFGEGCSKQCGDCLHGRACHHITGRCDLGCDPGWQKTDECNITCENGTFGKDCVHKCDGHCLNDEPCNNTDGTCSKCSSGWAGEFCNITERLLKEEKKHSVGIIVGALIVVIVFLTCVTFAIHIVSKKHKSNETSEKLDNMNIYDLPNKGDKDYDYVNALPSRDQST